MMPMDVWRSNEARQHAESVVLSSSNQQRKSRQKQHDAKKSSRRAAGQDNSVCQGSRNEQQWHTTVVERCVGDVDGFCWMGAGVVRCNAK